MWNDQARQRTARPNRKYSHTYRKAMVRYVENLDVDQGMAWHTLTDIMRKVGGRG